MKKNLGILILCAMITTTFTIKDFPNQIYANVNTLTNSSDTTTPDGNVGGDIDQDKQNTENSVEDATAEEDKNTNNNANNTNEAQNTNPSDNTQTTDDKIQVPEIKVDGAKDLEKQLTTIQDEVNKNLGKLATAKVTKNTHGGLEILITPNFDYPFFNFITLFGSNSLFTDNYHKVVTALETISKNLTNQSPSIDNKIDVNQPGSTKDKILTIENGSVTYDYFK